MEENVQSCFGVKNSNVELESDVSKVEKFIRAIRDEDIDTIITYVKSGDDINVEYPITKCDVGNIRHRCSWTEWYTPLEFCRNKDIERYLRNKGALTSEEKRSLFMKENGAEMARIKAVTDAMVEARRAYIRKRIAEEENETS